MSDLYDFKIYPDEFLLFLRKFSMNLAATGRLEMDAKIRYLHKLLRGEALRQFDLFCFDVKIQKP